MVALTSTAVRWAAFVAFVVTVVLLLGGSVFAAPGALMWAFALLFALCSLTWVVVQVAAEATMSVRPPSWIQVAVVALGVGFLAPVFQ